MQRQLTIDEESHFRAVWSVLARTADLPEELLSIQRSIYEMLHHNTTDGLPYVEPPLTDEDARARILVMVKDDKAHGWHGPRMLAACCPENYFTFTPSKSTIVGFRYCRRATAEEIAAAGLETPDA